MFKKTGVVFSISIFLLFSSLNAVIIRVVRMTNDKGVSIRLWGDMHIGRTALERRLQLRKMTAVTSALARNKAQKVVFLLELYEHKTDLKEKSKRQLVDVDFDFCVSRLKRRKIAAIKKAVQGALDALPESVRGKVSNSPETLSIMAAYARQFLFSDAPEGFVVGGYPKVYSTFVYINDIIPKSRNISIYRLDTDRIDVIGGISYWVVECAVCSIYNQVFSSHLRNTVPLARSFGALKKIANDFTRIARGGHHKFNQECARIANKMNELHSKYTKQLSDYLNKDLMFMGDLYLKGLLGAVALGKKEGYALQDGKSIDYFKGIVKSGPIDVYIKLREMKREIWADEDIAVRCLDLRILNQAVQEKDAKTFVVIVGEGHLENLVKDFESLGYKITFDSKMRDVKGKLYNSYNEKGFDEMSRQDKILPVKLSAFETRVDKKSEGLLYKVINDLKFAAEDVKIVFRELNRKFGPKAVIRLIGDGIAGGLDWLGMTSEKVEKKPKK